MTENRGVNLYKFSNLQHIENNFCTQVDFFVPMLQGYTSLFPIP